MFNPKLPPIKVKPEADDSDASLQLKEPSRDAEPLSPTARFYLSDEFYTTITCALELKDRMEIGELRTILSDTLLKHPRTEHRGRCKDGEQVWVRTTVDMAYHVVEGTQPDGYDNNADSAERSGAQPDDERGTTSLVPARLETRSRRPPIVLHLRTTMTEYSGPSYDDKFDDEELGRKVLSNPLLSALAFSAMESACYEAGSMEWHMRRLQHQKPLDASRPLWRVYLVPLPHGRSAALFRIHHSMGDGVSLMSLLLACTRRTDNPALLPTLPSAKRQTHPQPSSAGSQPSSGAAAAVVEESEELRKQLGDSCGPEEEEQLKPGKVHMPSAASAFTLDSMTVSPFNPDSVGQADAAAQGVTADAGGNGSAGGGGALGKEAGAVGKRGAGGGAGGGLVSVGRRMWQVVAVLANTLWFVSTFMAVVLWHADTATCIKMKPGSGGMRLKAVKGGKGSGAVQQQPDEGGARSLPAPPPQAAGKTSM
ncbi:unnamed protein product [Closterium sp. Yama58-4]|nr:unnamed protein product [Closterium sp. Yama58-4]